jgi:perosamine synthetase
MTMEQIRLRVFSIPPLSPFELLSVSNGETLPEPYGSERVRFYHNGRNAIWQAIRTLSFTGGENVLFPGFQCGSELDPFIQAGVPVRFYPVGRRFEVDLNVLDDLIDGNTKAVYVVHYFGFPQRIDEIARFCRERRLSLIEDCAHLLTGRYKGRMLGTFGDLSIFSMRKFLPTPDGGALRVNNPELPIPGIALPPPFAVTAKRIRKKISQYFDSRMGPAGRLFRRAVLRPPLALVETIRGTPVARVMPEAAYRLVADQAEWGMSPFSRRLLGTQDFDWIAERRRENFRYYLGRVEPNGGVKPVFRSLPEDVSPLVFPVLVEDADSFVKKMYGIGIEIRLWSEYFHPQFPAESFSEDAYLKRHIAMLPVHQDLDAPTLEWIADAVAHWKA